MKESQPPDMRRRAPQSAGKLLLNKNGSAEAEPKNAIRSKSALAELRSATGGFEAVLAYSLAPVFLDFMGFLASALKCCPSI